MGAEAAARVNYSPMQLWTIKNFGKTEYFKLSNGKNNKAVVNTGPMGVGKTYILCIAFGLYCLRLRELGYTDLKFALIGRTYNSIKRNMLNVLAQFFGNDFKYDYSTKDGITCDGRLFGFPMFFIPLNDANAESRIRGLTDITGVLIDELTLITEDQYALIQARIRGGQRLPEGYVNNWLIASTNPDSPKHWLLMKYITTGLIRQIRWRCRDACWDGFREYIENIKRLYEHLPAFYQRYVLGLWSAAEGLVFSCFDASRNTCEGDVDYKHIQRTIIAADYGSNHKTAVTVVHRTYFGTYIVSQVYNFQRTAISKIANKICDIFEEEVKMKPDQVYIYCDPAAQALRDECRLKGLAVNNAKNDVADGINYVNNLFDKGQLIILRNEGTEQLVTEIYNYKYKKDDSDDVVKIDDDNCDSLRYAVYSDHKNNE